MSGSHTYSNSNTYTESRARYVMGKIFDDFSAIGLRGFSFLNNQPDWLQRMKEDIFFLMTKKALKSFQIQFYSSSGEEWAVEFIIKADGTIHQDSPSGRIDYWDIPQDVTMDLPVAWKDGNTDVDEEMIRRGWTGKGKYIEGDSIDDGTYSKDGYGATKTRKGSWNQ